MSSRPSWVMDLQRYINDDADIPEDGSDDALLDDIADAVNAVLCGHYGHAVVDDMCGKPEHRYCVHCNRRASELD